MSRPASDGRADDLASGGGLRSRAESLLETGERVPPDREFDPAALVHELRVHQAELEIQNQELREAQQALELSSRRHRDLFDFAPVGYFVLDVSGAILEANLAGAELLGTERRFLERKPFSVFLPPESHETFFVHRREVLATGLGHSCELPLVRRGGERRTVRLHASVLQGEGTEPTYVAAAIDVTELRRAEEERARLEEHLRRAAKLEAVGTLAAGIAHDFNNLLTAIMGQAELVHLRLPSESPVQASLAQIVRAGDRAADLVRRLLAFSRSDEAEAPRLVELPGLVAEAVALLRATVPDTVELRTELDSACGPVRARASQLLQILVNLCANARDALQEAGGELTIRVKPAPAAGTAGRWVSLSVSDTGAGIPAHLVDRVFDPYVTTKFRNGGTGLGLAIVHGIVGALGGEIRVQSARGAGTTFEVLLPEASGCEGAVGG